MKYGLLLTLPIILMLTLAGCATTPAKEAPSDEAMVRQVLESWKQAVNTRDVDAIMALYSEAFRHSEARDKAAMRTEWIGSIERGEIPDTRVDLSKAQVEISGSDAHVTGIFMDTTLGKAAVRLQLIKEEGVWRVIENHFVEADKA